MEHPVAVPETPSAPDFEGAVGFAPSASQLLFHHNNLRPTVFNGINLNPAFNGSGMTHTNEEDDFPPAYELADYYPAYDVADYTPAYDGTESMMDLI